MNDKPKSNPKVDKFIKEINDISAKYQYKLVPVLRMGNAGIFPGLEVADVVPEDKAKGNGEVPIIKDKSSN